MAKSLAKSNTKTVTNKISQDEVEKAVKEEKAVEKIFEEKKQEQAEVKIEVRESLKTPVEEELIEPNGKAIINCYSIYGGTLIYTGERTTYTFEGMGSRRGIYYQDLVDGLLNGRDSIMKPYIIIDDDNVLKLPLWQEIAELYESLYTPQDLRNLIKLPTVRFNEEFPKLPVSAKEAVKNLIVNEIEAGRFDSLNKIHTVDEICGSSIALLLDN